MAFYGVTANIAAVCRWLGECARRTIGVIATYGRILYIQSDEKLMNLV